MIPGAVPVYNIILLLNFFRQTPRELEEAAIMDGASQWRILWQIFVPTSKAALATVALYLHCVSLERMVQRHHLQQRSGAISFAELHANHRH